MYAPSLGAFTSLDTFAGSAQDPLSLNRFLYAEANPATLIDPTGHRTCTGQNDDDCDSFAGLTDEQREKVIKKWKDEAVAKQREQQDCARNGGCSFQSTGSGGAAPPSGTAPTPVRVIGNVLVGKDGIPLTGDAGGARLEAWCEAGLEEACAAWRDYNDAVKRRDDAFCAANRALCDARNEQTAMTVLLGLEVVATAVSLGADADVTLPAEGLTGARIGQLESRIQSLEGEVEPGLWDLGWSARGYAIGDILGENLVPNFRTIDRWAGRTATSIKSMDLTVPSYRSGGAVYSKLKGYLDAVSGFEEGRGGAVVIRRGDVEAHELSLGIPLGGITPEQEQALLDAMAYGERLQSPVTLNIYEIP
jgi:hypothetical protein